MSKSTQEIILLDACVLYSAPLRDLLMNLHISGLFQARWTAEIHEEWMRNVLFDRPDLKKEQLERTRGLMDMSFPGSLVCNYEKKIQDLTLSDLNDRHVLAAAIKAKAGGILTFNLKDFPQKYLNTFGIKPVHPDEFFSEFIKTKELKFFEAARRQREGLRNPPKTVEEYLEIMNKQNIKKTIDLMKKRKDLL